MCPKHKNQGNTEQENFTLRDVIFLIQQIYKEIYNEEEKTADSQVFTIAQDCSCVHTIFTRDVINQLETADVEDNDEKCCVCYLPYNNAECFKLKCHHIFHSNCITRWIDASQKKQCPLCRDEIYTCPMCNNSKKIEYNYEGTVLPYNFRTDLCNLRNTTNGIYEIYGWDYEDLMINKMTYNRILRRLHITMSVG